MADAAIGWRAQIQLVLRYGLRRYVGRPRRRDLRRSADTMKTCLFASDRLIRGLALTLTIVAATTVLCSRVISVNAITAGFAYLLDVLAIATAWGLIEAVLASVAAMLCFNYFFLPPIGQFTIADPQNWVALFAFLATALIASQVSDREKRQAAEAKSRQRETEQLYALSRFILLTEPIAAGRWAGRAPYCGSIRVPQSGSVRCDSPVSFFEADLRICGSTCRTSRAS